MTKRYESSKEFVIKGLVWSAFVAGVVLAKSTKRTVDTMKAIPYLRQDDGKTFSRCSAETATHIRICIPGPVGMLMLPVMIKGSRKGTGNWTWNGDVEKPTLKPSVSVHSTMRLTDEEHEIIMKGGAVDPRPYKCHTWIGDGKAQFLEDCTHELKGQTLDLLPVEE